MNNQEITPLTREQQLEYLIPYLEEQIRSYQYDLDMAREELEEIRKEQISLVRRQ